MTWPVLGVPQTLPTASCKWITKSAHGQTGVPLPNTCQDLASHTGQSEAATQRHGRRRDSMQPGMSLDSWPTLLLHVALAGQMLNRIQHLMTSIKGEKKVDSNKIKAVKLWHFERVEMVKAWTRSKLGLAVLFLMKDRGCLFKEGCCREYRAGHFYIFTRSQEPHKDEWEQGQLQQSKPVLIEIWLLKGRLADDVKPTGHYCLHMHVWVNVSLFPADCCNLLNVFHGRMLKMFLKLR